MNRVLTDAERVVLLGRKVSEEIINPLVMMDIGDLVDACFKIKQEDGTFLWFKGEGTIKEFRSDLVQISLITPVDAGRQFPIRTVWTFRSMCERKLTSDEI